MKQAEAHTLHPAAGATATIVSFAAACAMPTFTMRCATTRAATCSTPSA